MHGEKRGQTPQSHCFRCTNGCIHVVCGNTTLTLKHLDFLVLAEAINSLRIELKQEGRKASSVSQTGAESLLM